MHGISPRLKKELENMATPGTQVQIIEPKNRQWLPWIGAAKFGECSVCYCSISIQALVQLLANPVILAYKPIYRSLPFFFSSFFTRICQVFGHEAAI
jgi:hypothetical protein